MPKNLCRQFVCISFLYVLANAGNNPFQGLTEFKSHSFCIRYMKKLGVIINKPVASEFFPDSGIRVYTGLISSTSPDTFTVDWNPGPSDDPTFQVFHKRKGALHLCGEICAEILTIPGNGFLYSEGRTDEMFNRKRKFVITQDSIKEAPQAFYHVGLETTTTREFAIYADTSLTIEVAKLPLGTPVNVLINTRDYYLLKTPFGLVGWTRISDGVTNIDTPLKELYFFGD